MAVTRTNFAPFKLTNGNAGVATQITFAGGTVGVFVHSVADGTQVSTTGTDGQALGDDFMLVTETLAPWYLPLPAAQYGNPPVIYAAHDDNAGVSYFLPVFGERP